ncbi:hypothetical protein CGJ02_27125, partial [Vibrio parahaemolyticus]
MRLMCQAGPGGYLPVPKDIASAAKQWDLRPSTLRQQETLRLLGTSRQFGHQTQRNRQLIELEMR